MTRSVEIPDKYEARIREVEEATWERVQAEREATERAFEVADQDYRAFVIARAFRGGWKPWEICGAIDLLGARMIRYASYRRCTRAVGIRSGQLMAGFSGSGRDDCGYPGRGCG